MSTFRRSIGLAAAMLTLAACDQTGPRPSGEAGGPAAASFSHAATSDLSGYYRPAAVVRLGRWRLDHVFIGQPPAFEAWAGGARGGSGPVMIQFSAVAGGPTDAAVSGGPRGVTARVLPTSYSVTDTRLNFEGRSPELGVVSFDGRLDPNALATARRNLGRDGVVLTGTLTAAGQSVRNVRLNWSMGD
ncbi:hypothetical protein [Brevundimonas sp.]|uniref:hypothetical protein n=1 Tax=Brevundimonas sp. TaxID=1871086 RepID=UPI002FCA3377